MALTGAGLTGAAVVLGLVAGSMASPPSVLHTARLALVAIGAVTAGAAVSMRPDLWRAWALAACASLLAVPGTPAHWDSFRLVFAVLTAVAAVGTILSAVSQTTRLRLISVMILFHFGGIFLSTVNPQPAPWLSDQIYTRFYIPYLQFIYLRNAYHFYSPQPGPASVDLFLLKTEVGEEVIDSVNQVKQKKYEYKWIIMPQRPKDIRDPLGLSYVRRLSLSEQTASTIPEFILPQSFERHEIHQRRQQMAIFRSSGEPYYPYHPSEPQYLQYRMPRPDVMRFILPSYAQYVILENTPDPETAARTTVKIYRLEHETLSVDEFRSGIGPFHPATYRPFFLGEYRFLPDPTDPTGKRTKITLIDPQEKMLYWMIPVIPRQRPPVPGQQGGKDYYDFLSAHALGVPIGDLEQEPHASRALNWDLLR